MDATRRQWFLGALFAVGCYAGDDADLLATRNQKVDAPQGDYPGAPLREAHPGNFSRGRSGDVRYIVIHDMEGFLDGAVAWFRDARAGSSAHYNVGGDGRIVQSVRERDTAWHAGQWHFTAHSIGVEHDGYAHRSDFFTPALYRASARLVAHLCRKYGVPIDRQHILGHYQVPVVEAVTTPCPPEATRCGGRDRHQDPGPGGGNWDWDLYMRLVREYAEGAVAEDPGGGSCPPRTDYWYCPPDDEHIQYRCRGGVWESRACEGGCGRRPVGEDDVCHGPATPPLPPPPSPCPERTDYWYCPAGEDHHQIRCREGLWERRECPGGCERRPAGEDDVCLEAPPPPPPPSCPERTEFWYCPAGEDFHQVRCRDGAWERRECPYGCERRPVGVDDLCLGGANLGCPERTDFWYCSPGVPRRQQRCRLGVWEYRACPTRCVSLPPGEDDRCE